MIETEINMGCSSYAQVGGHKGLGAGRLRKREIKVGKTARFRVDKPPAHWPLLCNSHLREKEAWRPRTAKRAEQSKGESTHG